MTKNRGAMRPRIEKKCEQNPRKVKKIKKIMGEKNYKIFKKKTKKKRKIVQ